MPVQQWHLKLEGLLSDFLGGDPSKPEDDFTSTGL